MTTWTLLTSTTFDKQLTKIQRCDQARILAYFVKRVLTASHPKDMAKPLWGEWEGLWRFRIGTYRVIADINDATLTIIALEVGHRRDIYH